MITLPPLILPRRGIAPAPLRVPPPPRCPRCRRPIRPRREVPRWRRAIGALAMADTPVYDTGSGLPLYGADGLPMCGCQCGETAPECNHCVTGTTRATQRVTFAGMTACTCAVTISDFCFAGGFVIGPGPASVKLNINPNGVFDLIQDVSQPCVYSLATPGAVTAYFGSDDCTIEDDPVLNCTIILTLAPGLASIGWNLQTGCGFLYSIFSGDVVTANPRACNTAVVINNENTAGCAPASGLPNLATGGTASAIGIPV